MKREDMAQFEQEIYDQGVADGKQMNREIMQQALDALKNAKSVMGNLTSDDCSDCMYIPVTDAIAALEAELAKPEQEEYVYAKRLAEFIWDKHYKKESPDWTPLPDVLGVLTQIDNMTCGLELANPEQEPVAWMLDFVDDGFEIKNHVVTNLEHIGAGYNIRPLYALGESNA